MRVAITGATGFIGELLVKKHLELGDKIHILSRKDNLKFGVNPNIIYYKGDLSNLDVLHHFVTDIDVLYHCAAEIINEKKMQMVNVQGTKNLIEAASNKIKHWVQLSSVGVYGPIYEGKIDENQQYNPINEYEKTKLESDLLVIDASNKNLFTHTIIRPSNVFGVKMRNNSLYQLIKSIDKKYYFFIGKRGASANYIPVENVIEALYLASTNPIAKNKIYTISNWCTIEDFVAIISKILNKNAPKIRIPMYLMSAIANLTSFVPGNPLTLSRVYALSNRTKYVTTKIESELDYTPVQEIEISLSGLVEHYLNCKKNV